MSSELSATSILNKNIYGGQKRYWEMVKENYKSQELLLKSQAAELGAYINNLTASNPYSPDLQRLQMMSANIQNTEKQLGPLIENVETHIKIADEALHSLGGGGSRGGW